MSMDYTSVSPGTSTAKRALPQPSQSEDKESVRIKFAGLAVDVAKKVQPEPKDTASHSGTPLLERQVKQVETRLLNFATQGKTFTYHSMGRALWQHFGLVRDQEIGKGRFGRVYDLHNLANEHIAFKKLSNRTGQTLSLCGCNEVNALAIEHNNILKTYALLLQKNTGDHFEYRILSDLGQMPQQKDRIIHQVKSVFMEYLDGMNLRSALETQRLTYSEDSAIVVGHALSAATQYLHSRHITHQDIKPENIMLTKTAIKLVDFGSSKDLSTNKTSSALYGSPIYMAPEAATVSGSALVGQRHDQNVDNWSTGATVCEVAYNKLPYQYDVGLGLIDENARKTDVIKANQHFARQSVEEKKAFLQSQRNEHAHHPELTVLIVQLFDGNPATRKTATEAHGAFSELSELSELYQLMKTSEFTP